jgi:hypothetical protein
MIWHRLNYRHRIDCRFVRVMVSIGDSTRRFSSLAKLGRSACGATFGRPLGDPPPQWRAPCASTRPQLSQGVLPRGIFEAAALQAWLNALRAQIRVAGFHCRARDPRTGRIWDSRVRAATLKCGVARSPFSTSGYHGLRTAPGSLQRQASGRCSQHGRPDGICSFNRRRSDIVKDLSHSKRSSA